MKLFVNIIANYAGKIWSIFSIYLFVPFYIQILGVESYGVINFFTVLTSLLLFLDLGLTSSISRELAQSKSIEYKRNLIFTIEVIFGVIAILIMGLIFFFSDKITSIWLVGNNLSHQQISFCVKLMGIAIAFNLFSMMQFSALMGLQKQVLANGLQVAASFFKYGLVIGLVYFIPKIEIFFYWQFISAIIFFIVGRILLWKQVSAPDRVYFDFKILKEIKSFSIGMMIMSLVAALNTQLDKLFVGKFLSLKEFSFYSLSSTLAQMPVLLITPLVMAVFPVLVKLGAELKKEELKKRFDQFSYFSVFLSTLFGAFIFFYTSDIAYFWTRNIEISSNISGITKYLIVGSVFLAAQYLPFQLALAHGHTKTSIFIGIGSIIFLIPGLWVSIKYFGINGATFPWIVINLISFFYLSSKVINMHFENAYFKWLFNNCIIPGSINILVTLLIYIVSLKFQVLRNIFISSILIFVFAAPINLFFFKKMYDGFSVKNVFK